MRQTRLRERLAAGQTCFGLFVNFNSPAFIELAGLAGFDWVFLDAEYGTLNEADCEQMVRAAETVGLTTIIRLPYPDPRLINRFLNTGAMGVLVPHLRSREVAEEVVAYAKFAPRGRRSSSSVVRAADYGLGMPDAEYSPWANEETMVFGILEDREAVENLPEILAVDGIDGFIVGPGDLSHAYGVPGQWQHPVVQQAVEQMTAQVLASNKHLCGIVANPATMLETTRSLIDRGIRMIAIPTSVFVAHTAQQLSALRDR